MPLEATSQEKNKNYKKEEKKKKKNKAPSGKSVFGTFPLCKAWEEYNLEKHTSAKSCTTRREDSLY